MLPLQTVRGRIGKVKKKIQIEILHTSVHHPLIFIIKAAEGRGRNAISEISEDRGSFNFN